MVRRALTVVVLWLVTLCVLDIKIVWSDGLSIDLHGWGTPLWKWLHKRG